MFAYLRSIPPITNFVPSAKVPEEALWQIAESNRRLIEALESQ